MFTPPVFSAPNGTAVRQATHRPASQPSPTRSAPGYLFRQRGTLHFRIRVPDALRPWLGISGEAS